MLYTSYAWTLDVPYRDAGLLLAPVTKPHAVALRDSVPSIIPDLALYAPLHELLGP